MHCAGLEIDVLARHYCGFFIDTPVGNNAFSFELRCNKRIYVPPLLAGTLDDLEPGREVTFSEVLEGQELNKCGLANMVYLNRAGKDIFIFDNHNHAFFFWLAGLKMDALRFGQALVHVDQHTDMREPMQYFETDIDAEMNLQKVFEYTNFVLNVGNFIKPARSMGLFSQVEMIDSSAAFEKPLPDEFVLDIDIDIFAPDMAYIEHDYKMARIRSYIDRAKFITIATSPYFMDQQDAIYITRELLESL